MTTDAPPEKMTNAELAAILVELADYEGWQPPYDARLREAARRLSDKPTLLPDMIQRLSAPAPAAPRVGDDADWRALKKFGRHSAKCTAYQDDDKPCICGYSNAVGAAFDRLISAPPAASADERVELDDVIHEVQETVIGHIDTMYPGMWQAVAKSARLSVRNTIGNKLRSILPGYRKLAPAQSVGQSAAQGVGEWLDYVSVYRKGRCNADSVAKFIRGNESDFHWGGTAYEFRDLANAYLYLIDRLSALPKGQDDE